MKHKGSGTLEGLTILGRRPKAQAMRKALVTLCGAVIGAAALIGGNPPAVAEERGELRDWLRSALDAACPKGLGAPIKIAAALDAELLATERNGETRLTRDWLALERSGTGELVLTANSTAGQLQSLVVEAFEMAPGGERRPALMARVDRNCAIVLAREIAYDDAGIAESLVPLNAALAPSGDGEPLNPPVPKGRDPGGVLVVLVDSGVNYLLPDVAERLARDKTGAILGYDYWDLDERPFDLDSGRSPFLPMRHGTAVASLLLREAPEARLVPYRYPRPDMNRMSELIAAAEAVGAGIVAMAMGSKDRSDWRAFESAAKERPEMLFIVSAGNDGRDIDETPTYPASLEISNMLVVTSADAFGRLATGSNWGRQSVDLMVPGERVEVIDHRGARATASGSSYAVPRVAALAARLWAENPEWNANTLRHAILARAVVPRIRGQSPVSAGWIPNPADGN